jgi:outer membrane biosynthesis protein TonB
MSSYIVQGSEAPAFDQETLAMLVRAHPIPPPAQELSKGQPSLVAPVRLTII